MCSFKQQPRRKVPKLSKRPIVSICTPTYNRRPFIPAIIKCIEQQTYPINRIEWIIVDDGTDPIDDLVKHLSYVKYYYKTTEQGEKLSLGQKRNMMNELATGEVIVYMDDDDYYPPKRVEHAVETLRQNARVWCVGSSCMHIYFPDEGIFRFGPYGPNHATAATFAFHKELIKYTRFSDSSNVAEESNFLKKNTQEEIIVAQLDTEKTILVISHKHSTVDKKHFLKDLIQNPNIHLSKKSVDNFIQDKELKNYYLNIIPKLLLDYLPGHIINKVDAITQQVDMMKSRFQIHNELKKIEETDKKLLNSICINSPIQMQINTLTQEYTILQQNILCLKNKLDPDGSLPKHIFEDKTKISFDYKAKALQLLQQNTQNIQENNNISQIDPKIIKISGEIEQLKMEYNTLKNIFNNRLEKNITYTILEK